MRTAFVGGTLIDGSDGRARPRQTVVVDGAAIVEVSDRREFGPDTRVVDVAGRTIMPGLIDSHVHFAAWAQWLVSLGQHRLMLLASKTVRGMARALEWGVTSARDMGGLEAGFPEAVRQGLVAGPRLQNGLVIIETTNGVLDNLPSQGGYWNCYGQSLRVPGMPDPHCDGPWEARRKVREVMLAGADVIKIASSSMTVRGVMHWEEPTMTREELDAIVAEAHAHGMPVLDHVMGAKAVQRAVEAGVDTIEHGCHIDDQTLDRMAAQGVWLVPMFWVLDFHVKVDPTDDTRSQARRMLDETAATLARALRAGVPVAMGSDGGTHDPEGSFSAKELEFMTSAGMSAADALVAATRRAAECLRLSDTTGTVSAGKQADLLVVDGNPLEDIRVLQNKERLALVLKDGVPVGGTATAADMGTIAARLAPLHATV
jgi:imidazolonepropionase-like amidohydrolase